MEGGVGLETTTERKQSAQDDHVTEISCQLFKPSHVTSLLVHTRQKMLIHPKYRLGLMSINFIDQTNAANHYTMLPTVQTPQSQ